jgi:hypothetical protein
MKKQQLDEAWVRMQDRLKQEPESMKWTAFSEMSQQPIESPADPMHASDLKHKESPITTVQLSAPPVSQNINRGGSAWLQRHKRWIAGTAAAIVLGLTLATPTGNHVLASLMNQFRMEQLTVVEEQDLEHLFNTVGLTESTMNQYGEFAHFSEGEPVSYSTIEQLQDHAGREVVIPEIFRTNGEQNLQINVSPAHTITMKVKVNEINDTLRKLGADTLLPPSIDGKQITLTMGKRVSIELYQDQTQTAYSLNQLPAPSITVEAGVPLEEALEAVLRFPLIPTQLKQELKQSHVLDTGSAPLPIVMPDGYEKIQIANTEVLLSDGGTADGRYSAVWAKDGQLLNFRGTFPDRDAFTTMLREVISS